MSKVPNDLKYTKTHEWIRFQDKNTVIVGITDHAQSLLGDLVFVELPPVEASADEGDEVAVVESVKAAADVYAPIAGEVIEVNEVLNSQPELINQDPYGQGWLFKLHIDEHDAPKDLMNADLYQKHLQSEAH